MHFASSDKSEWIAEDQATFSTTIIRANTPPDKTTLEWLVILSSFRCTLYYVL